ncbi:MAG TPA: hypothetical protein VE912_00775 [Bacteroidales bacterium]|nr:hypothetical protein [Bacteroidales bacterium]
MKQLPDKTGCSLGGRLTKTHGFNGELILRSVQPLPESIEETEFVFIDINDGLVPFFLLSARLTDETCAIIQLEDTENEEQAERLIGYEVYLPAGHSNKKPESGKENYSGFQIIDKVLGDIGIVNDFLEIPGNPLLQTEYNGSELLIPFNKNVVQKISNRKKQIRIKLPEGLLDLA